MTNEEWVLLAAQMEVAADALEKVSACWYGDAAPESQKWTAQELRKEAAYVRRGEWPAVANNNEKGISK